MNVLADFRRDPGGCLVARLDRPGTADDATLATIPTASGVGEAWAPQVSLDGLPNNVTKDERG